MDRIRRVRYSDRDRQRWFGERTEVRKEGRKKGKKEEERTIEEYTNVQRKEGRKDMTERKEGSDREEGRREEGKEGRTIGKYTKRRE